MINEGLELQMTNVNKYYEYLKEEKVVTSKDVTLEWIRNIGIGYDGVSSIGGLRAVIDELVAYAMLGKEASE